MTLHLALVALRKAILEVEGRVNPGLVSFSYMTFEYTFKKLVWSLIKSLKMSQDTCSYFDSPSNILHINITYINQARLPVKFVSNLNLELPSLLEISDIIKITLAVTRIPDKKKNITYL